MHNLLPDATESACRLHCLLYSFLVISYLFFLFDIFTYMYVYVCMYVCMFLRMYVVLTRPDTLVFHIVIQ